MKTIVLLLLTISLYGCSGDFSTEFSEQTVKTFHTKLNENDISGINAIATDVFIKGGSKEKMIQYFTGITDKFGKHVNSTLSSKNVHMNKSNKVIYLVYNSKFEKGEAVERFVLHESDNISRLHSYKIQ